MKSFSIDVEEWFHLLDTDTFNDKSSWDSYPSRVEENFTELLKILDKHQTKATCFFLGWIAEKYPQLVKMAYNAGHEIGVHGYYHNLIYKQSYNEFYTEISESKKVIERIIGDRVYGFRAPSFSINENCLWAYRALMELGFTYSSSVHPKHYRKFGQKPRRILFNHMELLEVPLPSLNFPFAIFSPFGGGYFRISPLLFFKISSKFFQHRPFIFYIHPRDIDLKHPKIKMTLKRKLKSLINIKNARFKLNYILDDFDFEPISKLIFDIKDKKLFQTSLLDINDETYEFSGSNYQDQISTKLSTIKT